MKLVSWNVNGIRACMGKDFMQSFAQLNADIFCLQETKCQVGQVTLDLPGYEQFWYSAEKKGYSGTAIFTKVAPLSVRYGIGVEEFDHEGRVIALEYPDFWMVTVYTPNSQDGLARLPYRMQWEEAFRGYLKSLEATHPVIVCGDMNVAHKEIDIRHPKTNIHNAGFTQEERDCMTALLGSGFVDSFRYLYPDRDSIYSWWSYRFHARENNAGWRIDYFLVSDVLKEKITEAGIHNEIYGSDHCPVSLEIAL
ncbi:MAG: exodeoxyribonuclease III [Clostridia bacterium]|nr:exodeoxyribonuclease III [Clostridia bacterium]MBR2289022.1 exodeoxyribonuclease III [Clostridia bacterium]